MAALDKTARFLASRHARSCLKSPISGRELRAQAQLPASFSRLANRIVALATWRRGVGQRHVARARSEEHTSELQSRLHLVCRLLLEKKKKILREEATTPKKNDDLTRDTNQATNTQHR